MLLSSLSECYDSALPSSPLHHHVITWYWANPSHGCQAINSPTIVVFLDLLLQVWRVGNVDPPISLVLTSDRACFFNRHGSGLRWNKANLRDLIAATGLVILLKFDPNHRFFSLCDLEIWCITSKNNRAPLLYHIKLCVSFQIHRWIETEVALRKRSIRAKISDFLSLVTLKFDGWPWKTIGHLFYSTWSFVHHFKSIGELKLKLQCGNAQFRSKSVIFCPVWPWNLMDDLGKQ